MKTCPNEQTMGSAFLVILFGALSGCLLSVLVGVIGSRRLIGFGWAFLISLIFTPLVGMIVALLTDPLPGDDRRWGCSGTLLALLWLVSLVVFLLLLLAGGMLLVA